MESLGVARVAEAHEDDVGAVVGGVDDARDDVGVLAGAVGCEHGDRHEVDTRVADTRDAGGVAGLGAAMPARLVP